MNTLPKLPVKPALFIGVAMVLTAVATNGDGLAERLSTTSFSGDRALVFSMMWEAIQDRPLTGFGMGILPYPSGKVVCDSTVFECRASVWKD